MYRIQYGMLAHHANCTDNLRSELRAFGIEADPLPTPLNLFQNVEVTDSGPLILTAPRSRRGDPVVLRAEMDLVIALSACPAPNCNGGVQTKSIAFEVLES